MTPESVSEIRKRHVSITGPWRRTEDERAIRHLLDVIDQLVEAGDDLLGYCGVPKHIEAWDRAKLAVCERTETAPTDRKPTIQADAR